MPCKRKADLVVPMMAALAWVALALSGCEQGGGEAPAAPAATAPAADQEAEPIVLHFDVAGMHCEGCVNAITTAVGNLEGVTACEVSLEEESATVTVTDPTLAETIIETINNLNYAAERAEG